MARVAVGGTTLAGGCLSLHFRKLGTCRRAVMGDSGCSRELGIGDLTIGSTARFNVGEELVVFLFLRLWDRLKEQRAFHHLGRVRETNRIQDALVHQVERLAVDMARAKRIE